MNNPPPLPKKESKKPNGSLRIVQIVVLVVSVPLLLFAIAMAILELDPESGAVSNELPSQSWGRYAQLDKFADFVDRTQSAERKIIELERLTHEVAKAGVPMSVENFTPRSLAIRDEIEGLRAEFHSTFGATINEYPGGFNGEHPQLYQRCNGSLNRLFNYWYEWHLLSTGNQASGESLAVERRIYSEEIAAAKELIAAAKLSSP